jgi:hypothetical protein
VVVGLDGEQMVQAVVVVQVVIALTTLLLAQLQALKHPAVVVP